jgi:hypothetical protein
MLIEKSKETRQLSLHPLAIHTFIRAQAGSLGKALSEAVMNSLDAFASTINVTVTATGFEICDDGQGFQSRDEIEAWFETLGFPHDDGNHRVFGKFGMGRAQMWAFARTVWVSNNFTMSVDVKRNGLDYDLTHGEDAYKGTKIKAVFYEPLTFQAQERVRDEFFALVKFVPGIVTYNDKVANKNPAEETWDTVTPQAWMRFDKDAHSLTVYNAGLLVANFPKYRFSCGGIVVTKPEATLSLNMARNEILEAECAVWKNLVKQFPKKPADYTKASRPEKLDPRDMEKLIREIKAGVTTLESAMTTAPKLVTSVIGRGVTYDALIRGYRPTTVLFVEKGNELGTRIHKLKRATVLDAAVLTQFGFTVEEFKAFVVASVKKKALDKPMHHYTSRYADNIVASVWSADAAVEFPEFAAGKKEFAARELKGASAAAYKAWYKSFSRIGVHFHRVYEKHLGVSNVAVGDSPTNVCWVDSTSQTFVLREKELVSAMSKPMPALTQYVCAMLLALLEHTAENKETAYSTFIELTTTTSIVGDLVLNLSRFYAREAADRDLPIPKTRLAEFDSLGVE